SGLHLGPRATREIPDEQESTELVHAPRQLRTRKSRGIRRDDLKLDRNGRSTHPSPRLELNLKVHVLRTIHDRDKEVDRISRAVSFLFVAEGDKLVRLAN